MITIPNDVFTKFITHLDKTGVGRGRNRAKIMAAAVISSRQQVGAAETAGGLADDAGQGRADGLAGGKEDRDRGKGAGGT